MRELARKLVTLEAATSSEHSDVPEGIRVCEKLRKTLTRVGGADGFTALMRRAVALARAEMPSLQAVDVTAGGDLTGLEDLCDKGDTHCTEASIEIVANLLDLLNDFIGEPLTQRLVSDAWPNWPPHDQTSKPGTS
jgi:hypothetical protein